MGVLTITLRLLSYILPVFVILIIIPGSGICKDKNSNTMLMFVGEDISVTTLASGKPESPANAPAVASVVTAAEISEYGYQTLAELLDMEPGFLMLPRGQGSVPYLRGMPDSVLFLYDGVPLTQGGTRNLNFLDRELSLKGVKRVEIVRGPGSVLWGADAFAGIVNIVPMTGLDAGKSKVSVYGGTDSLMGGSCSSGMTGNNWNIFLSTDVSENKFYDSSFNVTGSGPFDDSHSKKLDRSKYYETSFTASFAEKFSFSGRLFGFTRDFTMHDSENVLSWKGTRSLSPSGYLKGSWSGSAGKFNVKATVYYSSTSYDITKVDLKQDQKGEIWHTELLCDRNFFKTGLLTAGVSLRDVRVNGGVVSEDFLPQYLKPGNNIFLPNMDQKNYSDAMKSLFVQYRHRFAKLHWWAGVRSDSHSVFNSKTSFNFGFNLPFSEHWRLKAGFGTAYRTPYSSQIFSVVHYDPEGIETYNLQLGWDYDSDTSFTVTSFYSRLSDHVQYDPFGGLSKPFDQKTSGVEVALRTNAFRDILLSANASVMNYWGGSAKYILESTYYAPGGIRRTEYEKWEEPFDLAADYMLNLKVLKRFSIKGINGTFAFKLRKTGPFPYTYDKGKKTGKYNSPVIAGFNVRIENFFRKNVCLDIDADNILNRHYFVPGVYGPEKGSPFSVICTVSYRF